MHGRGDHDSGSSPRLITSRLRWRPTSPARTVTGRSVPNEASWMSPPEGRRPGAQVARTAGRRWSLRDQRGSGTHGTGEATPWWGVAFLRVRLVVSEVRLDSPSRACGTLPWLLFGGWRVPVQLFHFLKPTCLFLCDGSNPRYRLRRGCLASPLESGKPALYPGIWVKNVFSNCLPSCFLSACHIDTSRHPSGCLLPAEYHHVHPLRGPRRP